MNIREATSNDRDSVRSVHWSAFEASEREIISELAVKLLVEDAVPPIISLVAETAGVVVGHVAFSPVTIDKTEHFQGYILAPLAVKPDYQKRRIGSKLIESGIQQLSTMGVDIIFVYGDPNYYSKFGFNVDAAGPYVPPYQMEYPYGWQGIVLNEGASGKPPVRIVCVNPLNDPLLW